MQRSVWHKRLVQRFHLCTLASTSTKRSPQLSSHRTTEQFNQSPGTREQTNTRDNPWLMNWTKNSQWMVSGQTSPPKLEIIKDLYNPWNPLFITQPKNKSGHKFVETMDSVLAAIAEKQRKENIALYAAMLMPQLRLARIASEPDQSRNKTTKRLKVSLNGEID